VLDNLPHPLENFSAGRGPVGKGTKTRRLFADIIMQALNCHVWESETQAGIASEKFLLEDTEDFFWMCELAGIDGERFRAHLLRIQRGDIPPELL
jgi:hypothetical protein